MVLLLVKDKEGNDCTQWSPFLAIQIIWTKWKTVYAKLQSEWSRAAFKKLSDEGVTIIGDMQSYKYIWLDTRCRRK
jgi:hypothetical protein